ncbi:MAG: NADP-dependent oxidoreductase [Sciscionella sp.]|nr:NADP-dependent oxidoreductase [Sciscionella sp.]
MRAVVVREFGGPEALRLNEVDQPEPGAGQVRIRVRAAAVNPVDPATAAGFLSQAGMIGEREQLGIGWDVAGEIDAVGTAVTGFSIGQSVIGLRDRISEPLGTFADYVVLDAGDVAAAPNDVDPVEAASLPLNGLTALQALDEMELRAGDTLLVTGAAGAVGGYAVELGAIRGLRVIAIAGDSDADLVRGFGAEHVVPRGVDAVRRVRELVPGGVDGVLDAANIGVDMVDAVRAGGVFGNVVAPAAPPVTRGIRLIKVHVHADGAQLAGLARLAERGALSLRVADTYPLDKAAAALRRLAAGGIRGRLVLVP